MVAHVDSSEDGKDLYEHSGFVAKDTVIINFTKENSGD
jgi:hypothetical protein